MSQPRKASAGAATAPAPTRAPASVVNVDASGSTGRPSVVSTNTTPSGSGFEPSNTTRPLHVARPSDVRPPDGNPGPKYVPLRRARLFSASSTAGENVTASRSLAGRCWARGPAPPDSATGPVIVVSSRETVPNFVSSPQARSPLAPSTVTLPPRVSAPLTQSAHGA